MSPLIAVVIVNCLSAAALLSGGVALWRAGRSKTASVVAGVLLGVSFEVGAATIAIFYPVDTWAWASVKVVGRGVELTLAVRFLLYLSERAKNGGLKVG